MSNKILLMLLGFILFLPVSSAQQVIPPGTILPVRLDNSLSSRSAKSGQIIITRLMQSVPSANLKAGAKIVGHVVSVTPAAAGATGSITLQFDRVEASGRSIPIAADLRALASPFEIDQAQVPVTGPDRGTPEEAWETVQVGGDVVYRGGGSVTENALEVGKPVANGVLVTPQKAEDGSCRANTDNNGNPQAFWLFSANACGTYGYHDITITHAGRSEPAGQATLSNPNGNVTIGGGSGMLLRVNGSGS